jgi:hypothetical protein
MISAAGDITDPVYHLTLFSAPPTSRLVSCHVYP